MDIKEYLQKNQSGFYKIITENLTAERRKQLYEAINHWRETENLIDRLSIEQIAKYEVHSHWFAGFIWFKWGQRLMGNYIGWKTLRKYRRYFLSLDAKNRIKILLNKLNELEKSN